MALDHRAQVDEFQRKYRTGLVTLLFTDIVGSTKLKQALGDREAVALMHHHHALVREILSQFHEGQEISTAGDSFSSSSSNRPTRSVLRCCCSPGCAPSTKAARIQSRIGSGFTLAKW